jgi:hypothetical protein
MQEPFIPFTTSAFAAAHDPLAAPNGDASSATKA